MTTEKMYKMIGKEYKFAVVKSSDKKLVQKYMSKKSAQKKVDEHNKVYGVDFGYEVINL